MFRLSAISQIHNIQHHQWPLQSTASCSYIFLMNIATPSFLPVFLPSFLTRSYTLLLFQVHTASTHSLNALHQNNNNRLTLGFCTLHRFFCLLQELPLLLLVYNIYACVCSLLSLLSLVFLYIASESAVCGLFGGLTVVILIQSIYNKKYHHLRLLLLLQSGHVHTIVLHNSNNNSAAWE